MRPIINKDVMYLFERNNVVNIRGLRQRSRPYLFTWVIYYAWVAAFVSWWTASPLPEQVFGPELKNLFPVVSLASSVLVACLIRKELFVESARICAVLLMAGMSAFLLGQSAGIQSASALLLAIALGVVNISILLPFIFALNNTEKLYAVVGSNILLGLIGFFLEGVAISSLPDNQMLWLSFFILLIALSPTLFFQKGCLTGEARNQGGTAPEFHPRLYLTLVLFCVFILLYQGLGKAILNLAAADFSHSLLLWYYAGGLLGGVIYFGLFAFSKIGIPLASNLVLGFLLLGLLNNAFAEQELALSIISAVSLGIGNTILMANVFYILGVIGKKYYHMTYIRVSVLFLAICGGMSVIVAGSYFSNAGLMASFIIPALVLTTAVMVLFLILFPLLAHYREQDWLKDTVKMEIDNEQLYLFQKYQLSKRETDVCKLLLQGYTMRQISGILSLSYSTVNTYCTASYRKLGINSRTELLLLFKDYDIK